MLQVLIEKFDEISGYPMCINTIHGAQSQWAVSNQKVWQQKKNTCSFKTIDELSEEIKTNPRITLPTVYLVMIPDIGGFFDTDWISMLPPKTSEILHDYNIPILLSQPEEYFVNYSLTDIIAFDKKLAEFSLEHNLIITHSIVENYNQNKTIDIGHRRIRSVYSHTWLSRTRSVIKHAERNDITEAVDDGEPLPKKDYICVNRTIRELRCLFYLNEILREVASGVPNNSWVSLVSEWGGEKIGDARLFDFQLRRATEFIDSVDTKAALQSIIPRAASTLPKILDGGKNWDFLLTSGLSHPLLTKYRRASWFEVVTETHVMNEDYDDIAILSEKFLHPIVNKLPFITLGHKKVDKLVRELGFHSYYDIGVLSDNTIDLRLTQLNNFLDKFTAMTEEEKIAWYKSQEYIMQLNYDVLVDTDWDLRDSFEILSAVSMETAALGLERSTQANFERAREEEAKSLETFDTATPELDLDLPQSLV